MPTCGHRDAATRSGVQVFETLLEGERFHESGSKKDYIKRNSLLA